MLIISIMLVVVCIAYAHATTINRKDLTLAANRFLNELPEIIASLNPPDATNATTKEMNDFGRKVYEEVSKKYYGEEVPLEKVENFTVKSSIDDIDIPVRSYQKTLDKNIPVIIYFHGGGWTRGSLDTHEAICRRLSKETGYIVLAVDYRLSPENIYPLALNDAEEVYKYVLANYGNKIILSGDSAGGNIAAGLTVRLINQKMKLPRALALFYPVLGELNYQNFTGRKYADGYFLTAQIMLQYAKNYLGNDLSKSSIEEVSPILFHNLKQFPYTIIVSAECDLLREEAENFYQKMKAVHNKIDLKVYPKVLHAFSQFFGLYPEAAQSVKWVAKKLKYIEKIR